MGGGRGTLEEPWLDRLYFDMETIVFGEGIVIFLSTWNFALARVAGERIRKCGANVGRSLGFFDARQGCEL